MAESKKRFGEVISKCWQDAAFKQRFLTDPKSVLKEFDIEVPAGLDVKVVENTEDQMFLTLPAKPSHGELSDDALDAVSGGAGGTAANTAQLTPAARAAMNNKFRTITVVTSAIDTTCSKGKECVPW